MQISRSDFEQLAAFRYALRRFLRFSEESAAKVGLTPQKHQALLAIAGFPGRDRITITELAERLQLAHHSVVGLVDRMVRDKLLLRERSAKDRRAVYVCLSSKGKALLTRLTARHKQNLLNSAPEMLQSLQRVMEASGEQAWVRVSGR